MLVNKNFQQAKIFYLLEKAATIKRFKYQLLGSELKIQNYNYNPPLQKKAASQY